MNNLGIKELYYLISEASFSATEDFISFQNFSIPPELVAQQKVVSLYFKQFLTLHFILAAQLTKKVDYMNIASKISDDVTASTSQLLNGDLGDGGGESGLVEFVRESTACWERLFCNWSNSILLPCDESVLLVTDHESTATHIKEGDKETEVLPRAPQLSATGSSMVITLKESLCCQQRAHDRLKQRCKEYENVIGIGERFNELEDLAVFLDKHISIAQSEGITADIEEKLKEACSFILDLDIELQSLLQKYDKWNASPKICNWQSKEAIANGTEVVVQRRIEHPSYRTVVRVEDFADGSTQKTQMAGDYVIVQLNVAKEIAASKVEEEFKSLLVHHNALDGGQYKLDLISARTHLYRLDIASNQRDDDPHCHHLLDLFDEVLAYCQKCELVISCHPDALVYCGCSSDDSHDELGTITTN